METIIKPLRPNVTDLLIPSVGKVLEFLVENRTFDYSKEEIAEGGEISKPTLYRIWPFLERNGLLQETRKYQNTQLYKINEKNELAKILIKLEIAAVKEQFKRMEMPMKKHEKDKEQKEIAKRMMERSRKGLYKLPKNWKFNRDEIYNR